MAKNTPKDRWKVIPENMIRNILPNRSVCIRSVTGETTDGFMAKIMPKNPSGSERKAPPEFIRDFIGEFIPKPAPKFQGEFMGKFKGKFRE